ncbi:hypothetical protein TREES_T100005507 [Tupaia chinensis]|uniref:Uncharacterized protein n=1 Tax=Tupaia chinensis TaxID=246437 RepID=L9KFM8_TUPCH|nr:hypothetical protein TREES_T100005507 [Tupaia chinensis]
MPLSLFVHLEEQDEWAGGNEIGAGIPVALPFFPTLLIYHHIEGVALCILHMACENVTSQEELHLSAPDQPSTTTASERLVYSLRPITNHVETWHYAYWRSESSPLGSNWKDIPRPATFDWKRRI